MAFLREELHVLQQARSMWSNTVKTPRTRFFATWNGKAENHLRNSTKSSLKRGSTFSMIIYLALLLPKSVSAWPRLYNDGPLTLRSGCQKRKNDKPAKNNIHKAKHSMKCALAQMYLSQRWNSERDISETVMILKAVLGIIVFEEPT